MDLPLKNSFTHSSIPLVSFQNLLKNSAANPSVTGDLPELKEKRVDLRVEFLALLIFVAILKNLGFVSPSLSQFTLPYSYV